MTLTERSSSWPLHDDSLDQEDCYVPYIRYDTKHGDLSGLLEKCLSARNMASISRQLKCHLRWRPLYRPWAGWSLMTAPQPVRDASVTSITRQQGAPSTRP